MHSSRLRAKLCALRLYGIKMASRKLSEKLSEILRDLEIGKWEFASSTSDLKKTLIASKLVSLEYKAHLLCKFNQASGAGLNYHSNAIEDKRLASYISQQNATSTSMIVIVFPTA